ADDGLWRRHAESGGDAKACAASAGRAAARNAGCTGHAGEDAGNAFKSATEFPRNVAGAGSENSRPWWISGTWKKEIAKIRKPERNRHVPQNPARTRGHQEA